MNYSTLSLSELKALAISNNAIPTGDKRSKQSWIDAIELSQRWVELDGAQPTTDEDFEAALSERECLGEFSDSEMEAMAVAADIANGNTDMWADESALAQTVELASIAPQPAPVVEQVLNCKSDKKRSSSERVSRSWNEPKRGAATVFSALLCILILTVQAVLCIGCVIVHAAIHLKNLFGCYNPNYDLFGQLHDMVRQRKSIVSYS